MSKELAPCYAGRLLDSWLEAADKEREWLLDQINERRARIGLVGKIAYSNLWRWRMGRQKPDVNHAAIVADITAGVVPMSAWADGAESAAAAA